MRSRHYHWPAIDYALYLIMAAVVSVILWASLALTLSILTAPRASAHQAVSGFEYPVACCSNRDCAEISPDRVKPVSSGYLIDGKHLVPHQDVKRSPDGEYHACFPTPDILRCFWAPPPGV